MNQSIIDRIFPSSSSSVLPRYERHSNGDTGTASPPRIDLRDSPPPGTSRSFSPRASLKQAPLSASIVHHDDPFLPTERAAKSLEKTLQTLLDAQSEGLSAALTGGGLDDASSAGSATPTPSVATPSKSHGGLWTVPIRQPMPKRITLRSARRGIAKSMEHFAELKTQELHIIDAENSRRAAGLQTTKRFEDQKASLSAEMEAAQGNGNVDSAAALRSEASKLDKEIGELEDKLLTMRAQHRHLMSQAKQVENTMDSKLSSYKQSIALIQKDVKQFLRQPPISGSLSTFDGPATTGSGMYSLTPDRRTLRMAQEQWSYEQDILSQRRGDVETERQALLDGAKLWRGASDKIKLFEREMRSALEEGSNSDQDQEQTTAALLTQLNELIALVEEEVETAESNDWNLLICALGAELEALRRGREMLGGCDEEESRMQFGNGIAADYADQDSNNPPEDLLNGTLPDSPGAGSNKSLEDTMRVFGDGAKGEEPAHDDLLHSDEGFGPTRRPVTSHEESEDDDPGPGFLLSH